ncbi:unnamed protein product, partial [Closterium sp. Naga37s-1]
TRVSCRRLYTRCWARSGTSRHIAIQLVSHLHRRNEMNATGNGYVRSSIRLSA